MSSSNVCWTFCNQTCPDITALVDWAWNTKLLTYLLVTQPAAVIYYEFFLRARHDHNKIAPCEMFKVFWIELNDGQMSTPCPVERLLGHFQGQDHNWGSYNQRGKIFAISLHKWIFLHVFLMQKSFCIHSFVWWYTIISQSVLWKEMMAACVEVQGHNEGSKLQWMFVSPIFSMPLIRLQLN